MSLASGELSITYLWPPIGQAYTYASVIAPTQTCLPVTSIVLPLHQCVPSPAQVGHICCAPPFTIVALAVTFNVRPILTHTNLLTCALHIVRLCLAYCTPVPCILYTCALHIVRLCLAYCTPVPCILYTCALHIVHLCLAYYTPVPCILYIVHLCLRTLLCYSLHSSQV